MGYLRCSIENYVWRYGKGVGGKQPPEPRELVRQEFALDRDLPAQSCFEVTSRKEAHGHQPTLESTYLQNLSRGPHQAGLFI